MNALYIGVLAFAVSLATAKFLPNPLYNLRESVKLAIFLGLAALFIAAGLRFIPDGL